MSSQNRGWPWFIITIFLMLFGWIVIGSLVGVFVASAHFGYEVFLQWLRSTG